MSTTVLPPKGKGMEFDGAKFFNALSPEHQSHVAFVCQVKRSQGELDYFEGDSVSKLEKVARQYQAQLDAFQDVLTTQGFEICSDAPRDYFGRIAILSITGTLIMLGKPHTDGRHISMMRIHSPRLDCSGYKGFLAYDLQIGRSPCLAHIKYHGHTYNGSNTQGLAINPKGADGDELVEAETISTVIANRTKYLLNNPEYKPKSVVLKPH
jgi:hypothetical protein